MAADSTHLIWSLADRPAPALAILTSFDRRNDVFASIGKDPIGIGGGATLGGGFLGSGGRRGGLLAMGGIGGGFSLPPSLLAGAVHPGFGGDKAAVGILQRMDGDSVDAVAAEGSKSRGPAGEVGASSIPASTGEGDRSTWEPSPPRAASPLAVPGAGGQTPERPPQLAVAGGDAGGTGTARASFRAVAIEPPAGGAMSVGKGLGGAPAPAMGMGGGAAVALMKAVGGTLVGSASGGGGPLPSTTNEAQGASPTSFRGESTSALALRQDSGKVPVPSTLATGGEIVRAKPPVNSPDPLVAAPGTLPIGMPVLSAAGPLRAAPVQTITPPDFLAPPDLTAGLVMQSEFASRRLVMPKAPPLSGDFDLGGSDSGPGAGRFAGEGIVLGDGHYEDPIHHYPLTPPATLLLDPPSPDDRDDRIRLEQTRQNYHPTGAVASHLSTESNMPRLPFMENISSAGEKFAIAPTPALGTSVRGGAVVEISSVVPGGMRLGTAVGTSPGAMVMTGKSLALGRAPALGPMMYGMTLTAMPPAGLPSMEGTQGVGGGGPGPIERAARAEVDARDARLRNYEEKEKAQRYEETRGKYNDSRDERSSAERKLKDLPATASKEDREAAETKAAAARAQESQAKEEHQAARGDLGLEGEIPTQDDRKEEERRIKERLVDADAEEDRADKESSDASREAYDSDSASASDVDEELGRAINRLKEQREQQEQKAERKYANPKSVLDAREGKERARGIRDASNRREARLTQIRGKGDEKASKEARAASEGAKKAARDAERAERERERVAKTGTAEQAAAADQRAKAAQETARQKEREAREKMARAEAAVRQKARAREEEARNRGDSKYAAAKSQERRARAEAEGHQRKAQKYGREESRHQERKDRIEAKAKEIRDKGKDKNGKVSAAAERRASEYDKSAEREGAKEIKAERRRKAEQAIEKRAQERADRHADARRRREGEREKERKDPRYKDVHNLQRDADAKRDKADAYRDKATDHETKAREAESSGRKSAADYYDKLADEENKKAKNLEDSADQEDEEAKKTQKEIEDEEAKKGEKDKPGDKKEDEEDKKKDDTVVPEGTWPNCGPKPYCVDFRCGCPPECVCDDCWWEAGEPAQKGKGAVGPQDLGLQPGIGAGTALVQAKQQVPEKEKQGGPPDSADAQAGGQTAPSGQAKPESQTTTENEAKSPQDSQPGVPPKDSPEAPADKAGEEAAAPSDSKPDADRRAKEDAQRQKEKGREEEQEKERAATRDRPSEKEPRDEAAARVDANEKGRSAVRQSPREQEPREKVAKREEERDSERDEDRSRSAEVDARTREKERDQRREEEAARSPSGSGTKPAEKQEAVAKPCPPTEKTAKQALDELLADIRKNPRNKGSGAWASRPIDAKTMEALKTAAELLAAGDLVGMTNAVRHLKHYIANTGSQLEINVDQMRKDLGDEFKELENAQDAMARKEAEQRYAATGDKCFTVYGTSTNGGRKGMYASKAFDADWYYALGGFTVTYWAQVTVDDIGNGRVRIQMTIHTLVGDRYNWDKGKKVTIGPVTVKDVDMQLLHQSGLAKEYDVGGVSSGRTVTWDSTGVSGGEAVGPPDSGIPGRGR